MEFKLLIEKPNVQDFEYIVEEKNDKSESKLFVCGPYMQFGEKNRNGRIYDEREMVKEVARYDKEMIQPRRGIEPEPKASGSSGEPNNSNCTISLVVSFETPPAQATIG